MNVMSKVFVKEFVFFNILVNLVLFGGIMVEGGNWGEVMNGYFVEVGFDCMNLFYVVEFSKFKFGVIDGGFMNWYGNVDEYGVVIVFIGLWINSFMMGVNVNFDGGFNF